VTADPLLDVRDLAVTYGPITAVRDLSLTVAPGEVVALLGPNGAGKTSTLRAVSRLVPHGGDVRFGGQPTRRRSPESLARRGLLHVPEGRRIFPTLTVHENLQVATTSRGGRGGSDSHGVGTGLDDVYDLFPPLAALRDRGGWALSGGEQQMLAIGRALMSRPRLLLLDEPSLGLAPLIVRQIFDVLRNLNRREGLTVFLVEQNAYHALKLASRGYVMVNGVITMSGTGKELLAREEVRSAYLEGGRH
jgi:branched-chain amino acid transport system ATP-binding protein